MSLTNYKCVFCNTLTIMEYFPVFRCECRYLTETFSVYDMTDIIKAFYYFQENNSNYVISNFFGHSIIKNKNLFVEKGSVSFELKDTSIYDLSKEDIINLIIKVNKIELLS